MEIGARGKERESGRERVCKYPFNVVGATECDL